MPSNYLSAEVARGKLITSGDFSETNAPSTEILDDILEGIESRLDTWLGYSAAPAQYQELAHADWNGNIVLANFPVLAVLEVIHVGNILVPATTTLVYSASAIWRQGRTLRLGAFPGTPYRITYTAGYNPVPKEFGRVVFATLRAAIKAGGTSGDLSFLDEPTKDVSSISIPGLSKSYQIGKKSGGGGGSGSSIEGSQAEKLFKSLDSYRLRYIT